MRPRALLLGAIVLAAAPLAACGGAGDDEVCHPPAGTGPGIDVDGPMCKHLSSYRLFSDLPSQTADPALMPYELNTPLFSDYASKQRWMYIPAGQAATWQDVDSFDLPVGSVLVKSFSFPADLRAPTASIDRVETRILIHRTSGWQAASYVYNADDSEADLAVAGAVVPLSWIDASGATVHDEYVVPNVNQCGNCHGEHDEITGPLGPKARHLNRAPSAGGPNQLAALIAAGKLTGAPADMTTWPKTPVWDDPQTGSLDARARGYLDVNCSHCHNPKGAARTSGVDFSTTSPSMETLGICKGPTAAGRGAGGLHYDIWPGMPDASILIFRVSSTEADIKMPELGRNLVHAEGVAMLRDWVTQMAGTCPPPP